MRKLTEGEKSRLKNYGCENRIKHKISQTGAYVYYCLIDDQICDRKPSKCKKRFKPMHKSLFDFTTSKSK